MNMLLPDQAENRVQENGGPRRLRQRRRPEFGHDRRGDGARVILTRVNTFWYTITVIYDLFLL